MKKKKRRLSRRHFIAVSSLGAAGFWLTSSNAFSARFLRGILSEAGRPMAAPGKKPDPANWDANSVTAAWIGHATVLINFYGVTILTDPVFSMRVGVDVGFGTLGRKRLVAPALALRELPPIDLVLLSHAHMDHIDLPSLAELSAGAKVITAHATRDLLRETRLEDATELRWGEETVVAGREGKLAVHAFEVDHWGARWKNDTQRGYNGYVLEREGRKIIFGGDTAMTGLFRDIARRGPFDLALMPIGAYKPWCRSHCTPEEALQMSNDAGARRILPIHHQTFALGPEPQQEPIGRLSAALEKNGEIGRLAVRQIGDTVRLA